MVSQTTPSAQIVARWWKLGANNTTDIPLLAELVPLLSEYELRRFTTTVWRLYVDAQAPGGGSYGSLLEHAVRLSEEYLATGLGTHFRHNYVTSGFLVAAADAVNAVLQTFSQCNMAGVPNLSKQLAILRDVARAPGLPPKFLDVNWLTCDVVRLAQAIYAENDWQATTILADALVDAGCADRELLLHLQNQPPCFSCGGTGQLPGRPEERCHVCAGSGLRCGEHVVTTYSGKDAQVHVCGCWAVDLLTGWR